MNRKYKSDFIKLLDGNWEWKGDLLFKIPVNSSIKGLFFEKSASRKNEGYYIWLFFQPLYMQRDHIDLTYSRRLISFNNNSFWTFEDIYQKREDILEKTSVFEEPEHGYITKLLDLNNQVNIRVLEFGVYYYSLSDFRKSEIIFSKIKEEVTKLEVKPNWVLQLVDELGSYLSLGDKEREKVLKENREKTLKSIKLDKYI